MRRAFAAAALGLLCVSCETAAKATLVTMELLSEEEPDASYDNYDDETTWEEKRAAEWSAVLLSALVLGYYSEWAWGEDAGVRYRKEPWSGGPFYLTLARDGTRPVAFSFGLLWARSGDDRDLLGASAWARFPSGVATEFFGLFDPRESDFGFFTIHNRHSLEISCDRVLDLRFDAGAFNFPHLERMHGFSYGLGSDFYPAAGCVVRVHLRHHYASPYRSAVETGVEAGLVQNGVEVAAGWRRMWFCGGRLGDPRPLSFCVFTARLWF